MLQEFNGRVYATGNPQACFELGTGQTEISLRIPIGTQCGSVQSVGAPPISHLSFWQKLFKYVSLLLSTSNPSSAIDYLYQTR